MNDIPTQRIANRLVQTTPKVLLRFNLGSSLLPTRKLPDISVASPVLDMYSVE